jgi:ATP-binding cassette subfamily A (ABC1) protein 3
MLTGDVSPTAGSLFVAGHDISGENPRGVVEARKTVGLCPQVDPLLEGMTGRETLSMFARVRGVPRDSVAAEVQSLLELLTLTPHADKTTETYSGGSKRKLSLGIALIGHPEVLLIDESSSGIDPFSQRKIWDLIAHVARGRSVVLTTHSMDEAQALSSKTAIMANGKLLCLGSVQHLKVSLRGAKKI